MNVVIDLYQHTSLIDDSGGHEVTAVVLGIKELVRSYFLEPVDAVFSIVTKQIVEGVKQISAIEVRTKGGRFILFTEIAENQLRSLIAYEGDENSTIVATDMLGCVCYKLAKAVFPDSIHNLAQ